jgi:hypothetical protein
MCSGNYLIHLLRRSGIKVSEASNQPVKLRLGVVAMPFAVFTLYLFFSRWPSRWFTEASDFAGLGLAFASGLWYFRRWDEPLFGRALIMVAYVLIMMCLLFLYALFFVCVVFGDCL